MSSYQNNQTRRPFALAAMSVACAIAHGAGAAIVVTTSSSEWASQTGPFTTIDFTELAQGEFLTDQYAALGVTFTGTAIGHFSLTAFPTDNQGILGWTSKVVEAHFASPLKELAIEYGSVDLWVHLYLGDELVASTPVMSLNFDGPFVGIISETPFDRVEMLAPGLGITLIDNMYFGAPIPAPAGLILFGAAGWLGTRRRR